MARLQERDLTGKSLCFEEFWGFSRIFEDFGCWLWMYGPGGKNGRDKEPVLPGAAAGSIQENKRVMAGARERALGRFVVGVALRST